LRIERIKINGFRGFDLLTVVTRGHALFVGPPGCGRSDIVDAVSRVLDPDSTRATVSDDLDFHNRDTSTPMEIELVLGQLGDLLEQRFLGHTEPWDQTQADVVSDLADALGSVQRPRVLRIAYRATWLPHEERVETIVYFSKGADPDHGHFQRVTRLDRLEFPYLRVETRGQPLSLAEQSNFRRLIEQSTADDLAATLKSVEVAVDDVGRILASSEQVREAVRAAVTPVHLLLGLPDHPEDAIRFPPGGGSVSGLLRSLGAELNLEASKLPVNRLGSTARAILVTAQALAFVEASDGIVAVDDLGEDLDSSAGRHVAGLLAGRAAQVWASTRLPAVASAFDLADVVRLHAEAGFRAAHQLPSIPDRTDRLTMRHLGSQLIGVSDCVTVAVTEGQDDLVTLEVASQMMLRLRGERVLSAGRVGVVQPGALAGGGGKSETVRLAEVAKQLGFRTVIVLDGDTSTGDVEKAVGAADAVVRLPEGHAIETLLIAGVDADDAYKVLQRLVTTFQLAVSFPVGTPSASELRHLAIEVLKKRGQGLHAQYLAEIGPVPPGVIALVRAVYDAAVGTSGITQLQCTW